MVAAFQGIYWTSKVTANRFSGKYRSLTPYDQNQWAQFVCSFVKGSVVCATIYPIVWKNWPKIFDVESFDGGIKGSGTELPLYVFLGYALSDTSSVLSHFDRSKGDTSMLIHHIITAGGWIYLLTLDFGRDLACIACMVEFTTPLLALRWFMALYDLKPHRLYVANGLLILVAWWVFRVFLYIGFFGYKLCFIMQLNMPRDVPVVIAWAVGSALQLLWAYKLTIGFFEVMKEIGKKKKKIETNGFWG